jgi:hypothetical protein
MKTIKILKVLEVQGNELNKIWRSPMQKIIVENFEGFYIDTFEKINWKLYENKEISGFYMSQSKGFNWLQWDGKNDIIIINDQVKSPIVDTNTTPNILQQKDATKNIKILKVEKVSGNELNKSWRSPMQKIFVENIEGFYIDTFEKVNWKLYENQEIEDFYITNSSGYQWLRASEKGIKIISGLPNHTDNYSDFRNKYPAEHRTEDGHWVRSRAEVIIDNALFNYKLAHAYEKKLPVAEDLYSDFFIPNGNVYIEFWGMEEDPKYVARKKAKIEIYKKYNFNLIELNDKDIKNLDDYLPNKLLNFGIKVY